VIGPAVMAPPLIIAVWRLRKMAGRETAVWVSPANLSAESPSERPTPV
jgi:hypothetical protein